MVGLSPKIHTRNADLLIQKMKEGGALDEAIFSISIAYDSVQSTVTFGGYDSDKYAVEPI